MAIEQVQLSNTFEEWRQITNQVIDKVNSLETLIGTLTSLDTTNKTSLVSAINELSGEIDTIFLNIGVMENLTTTNKDSLVEAINEIGA